MYALIENNAVTKVGELAILFPNTSNPNHAFAIEQGALEVIEGEQKDQRFYWVTFSHYEIANDVVTRTYVNTPKALEDVLATNENGLPVYVQVFDPTIGSYGAMVDTTEQAVTRGLKSQLIAQAKQIANNELAQTDWCVTRKIERNIDIPADIQTKRAAILAKCDATITKIQSATTVEELM
jgi:hypothetical protein